MENKTIIIAIKTLEIYEKIVIKSLFITRLIWVFIKKQKLNWKTAQK